MERVEQIDNQKKVGVIIPCHNYGQYIVDAMDSVIEQDYDGDISIFIIDDGSVDDTIKNIVGEFKEGIDHFDKTDDYWCIRNITGNTSLEWNNRQLFIKSLPNPTGPSNARNVGIELAFQEGCEIIAFLDADDMMVSNKISRLVPEFDGRIGAVYADYYHLYPDDTFRIELKEIFNIERFIQENIGPNNTSLVTREALEASKENGTYFDPTMRTCEDYDLFLRVADRFPIKHVAEPLTFLRVHSNNSTNTVAKERWRKDRQRINEKILARQNSCK